LSIWTASDDALGSDLTSARTFGWFRVVRVEL
jgi:hypothetical protein